MKQLQCVSAVSRTRNVGFELCSLQPGEHGLSTRAHCQIDAGVCDVRRPVPLKSLYSQNDNLPYTEVLVHMDF